MVEDEQAIRDLLATWHRATAAGDLATVLGLMADDVLFLTPGGEPFGKETFAKMNESMAKQVRIESRFELGEIAIHGEWAHMWTRLWVTVTPVQGGAPTHRSGHTLSIVRKEAGKWLLVRDANMLAPEPRPQ